jgi:hypothetical protein
MQTDNSTNCKSCDFYHGENGLVCANHPSGPHQKNDCPDYRETVTLSVTTSEDITFQSIIKSVIIWTLLASFIGISWLGLTSLSLASTRYSWKQLNRTDLIPKSSSFLGDFHQASTEVFWTTVWLGSWGALIIFVVSGLVLIIAIPLYVIHVFETEGGEYFVIR